MSEDIGGGMGSDKGRLADQIRFKFRIHCINVKNAGKIAQVLPVTALSINTRMET